MAGGLCPGSSPGTCVLFQETDQQHGLAVPSSSGGMGKTEPGRRLPHFHTQSIGWNSDPRHVSYREVGRSSCVSPHCEQTLPHLLAVLHLAPGSSPGSFPAALTSRHGQPQKMPSASSLLGLCSCRLVYPELLFPLLLHLFIYLSVGPSIHPRNTAEHEICVRHRSGLGLSK